MNKDQLERAERTARRLDRRRETAKALEEAKRWERPISLRGNRYKLKPDDHYTFTDAQLAIAMNVLERKMNAGG